MAGRYARSQTRTIRLGRREIRRSRAALGGIGVVVIALAAAVITPLALRTGSTSQPGRPGAASAAWPCQRWL